MPKQRRPRGQHAVTTNRYRTSRLREVRLDNQVKRVGVCAVCGRAPVDGPNNEKPPAMGYRDFLCFRALICVSHVHVGFTVTPDGRLRFHELPGDEHGQP